MPEPRHQEEYELRQTVAARRVLVDIGQVLAAFQTQMVIVGGWVPELGFEPQQEAPHVGSIDVDLALNIQKLEENAYAEMIDLLLTTGRYRQGSRPFQLIATVDLNDGDTPVEVEKLIEEAVQILRTKFASPQHYGPMALAEFHDAQSDEEKASHARQAYELVRDFLGRFEANDSKVEP